MVRIASPFSFSIFVFMSILSTACFAVGGNLEAVCRESTRANYEGIAQPVPKYSGAYNWNPYLFSLAPSAHERRAGLNEVMKNISLAAILSTAQNSIKYTDASASKKFENFLVSFMPQCYEGGDIVKFEPMMPYACPFYDDECKGVLRVAMKQLSPCSGGYGFISLPHELLEMGTAPVFAKAAAKLALRTLNLVEQADRGIVPQADIFTDAKNAFVESGASLVQAELFALELLGIYGTRGPAMQPLIDDSFSNHENYIVFASLGVVASAMSYLDAVTLPTGHSYSLPNNVSGHCDFTRPYHFWLPAYLAFRMKQYGFNDDGIVRAIHIIDVGYETMAFIGTKSPDDVFKSKTYVTETQKNIAFGDVGIAWGILISKKNLKKLSPDAYMQAIINTANSTLFSLGLKTANPVLNRVNKRVGVDVKRTLEWHNVVGSEGAKSEIFRDLR